MQPLNILHLRDTYEIGGPGKTILETYRAIDQAQFTLHVAVFLVRGEREDSPFVTAARAQGMPVHFIRGRNQYDPRMIWQLAQLLKALRIDIVHAHEVKSDVLAFFASRLYRVPIVTTLHGWIAQGAKRRVFTSLDKQVARGFDRVIAVSSQIRDEILAAGVRADRLRLLHNAVVLERFRRTGRRGFLNEQVGHPLRGPVIASIGRLSVEKGHADLVEALAVVAAGGHAFSAVLAGDGPERGRLEQRVAALGLRSAVHFLGYVSEPARVLEDADLMVLPSHTEGLPNAVLEALALEVPVLATSVGGTPEIVIDGVTGRLVAPHDPAALAAAIADFLSNRNSWMETARRGREVVAQQFNFLTRTRRLEQIYLELAAEVV